MPYKYRIIVTNPGSVSEQFEVQSSYNDGAWNRVYQCNSLIEAERLYQDLIVEHANMYGYSVIKSQ